MNERSCLNCGKPLHGRVDQKFCDAQCRNTHHNKNKRPDEQYLMSINMIIRKNRRILHDLCPEGRATVRRDVLDALGYDYRYFTGIYKSKLTYYICYDHGFAPITEGNGTAKALIIQKQNYMDQYVVDPWGEQRSR